MILNYTPKKPQTYRKTVRQNHDKIYKKQKPWLTGKLPVNQMAMVA